MYIKEPEINLYIWNGIDKVPDNVEEVRIQDGVTEIKRKAFADKPYLKKVVMPNSIVKINDFAFCNCDNLKDIVFSNNIKLISPFAFWLNIYDNPFNTIDIPSNVKAALDIMYAHEDLEQGFYDELESVSPRKSDEDVVRYVHYDGKNEIRKDVEKVIIEEGVTEIKAGTFENCENLEEVLMYDSVTKIDDNAFKGCKNLWKVILSDNITYIGDNAFEGCEKLEVLYGITSKNHTLKNITHIGNNAFKGCAFEETVLSKFDLENEMDERDDI